MKVDRVEAKKGEFVQTAVEWLAKAINKAIEQDGECVLGLSGGSTPIPIYEALGKRTDMDWSKLKLFMVDERHVTTDHKDSNLRQVQETLLKLNQVPAANLFFPKVHLPYEECLADYDQVIKTMIEGSKHKRVSISVLGLGDDGHFASLFPHLPAPLLEASFDPAKHVIGTTTDVFAVHNRITTTYPVLVNAASSVFFLKGQTKVDVFESTVSSTEDHTRWPAKPVVAKSPTTALYEL